MLLYYIQSLSPVENIVLAFYCNYNNRRFSIKQLCEYTKISRATATRAIANLRQKGHLSTIVVDWDYHKNYPVRKVVVSAETRDLYKKDLRAQEERQRKIFNETAKTQAGAELDELFKKVYYKIK